MDACGLRKFTVTYYTDARDLLKFTATYFTEPGDLLKITVTYFTEARESGEKFGRSCASVGYAKSPKVAVSA